MKIVDREAKHIRLFTACKYSLMLVSDVAVITHSHGSASVF